LHSLLVRTRFYVREFASEFIPSETLADDLRDNHAESVAVSDELVLGGAMIVAEHLFVQIPEEVEWLGADVGAFESALEKTPKVFESVGVNLPVNVAFGVVNDLVDKILVQSLIGKKGIGVDRAASSDVLPNFTLDRVLAPIRNYRCADLATAFQDSHDRSFVFGASLGDADSALVFVHEASRTADESFVYFDFATDFPEGFVLQGEPDAMEHEPSRLLGDLESAAHFIGTDSILAVGEHPSRCEPLVEPDGRILKNGADLDGELALGVMSGALPDTPRSAERDLLGAASRAGDTLGPAPRNKVIEAVIWIREVKNRFLQALGFAHGLGLHESNSTLKPWMSQVNYCLCKCSF
jgi:hypothetical protein